MTNKLEYSDVFGREIKVGDYIVYGAALGRCAAINIGLVVELTHSKARYSNNEPKIRCRSYNPNSYRGGQRQKDVSLGFFNRLVVVPEDSVPDDIKKALND